MKTWQFIILIIVIIWWFFCLWIFLKNIIEDSQSWNANDTAVYLERYLERTTLKCSIKK